MSATQRTAEECKRNFKDIKSKSMNVISSQKKTGGGPLAPCHHDEVLTILGESDVVEGIRLFSIFFSKLEAEDKIPGVCIVVHDYTANIVPLVSVYCVESKQKKIQCHSF